MVYSRQTVFALLMLVTLLASAVPCSAMPLNVPDGLSTDCNGRLLASRKRKKERSKRKKASQKKKKKSSGIVDLDAIKAGPATDQFGVAPSSPTLAMWLTKFLATAGADPSDKDGAGPLKVVADYASFIWGLIAVLVFLVLFYIKSMAASAAARPGSEAAGVPIKYVVIVFFVGFGLSLMIPVPSTEADTGEPQPLKFVPVQSKFYRFRALLPEPISKEDFPLGDYATGYAVGYESRDLKKRQMAVIHFARQKPLDQPYKRRGLVRAYDAHAYLDKLSEILRYDPYTRITGEKVLSYGIYPGRQFTADITDGSGRILKTRMFIIGCEWLYQLTVFGEPSFVNSKEATRFLHSLKHIPGR